MFHTDVQLRREIWECATYILFFAENSDEDMRKYYLGKLAGIRSMLQYVDHKTLSIESFYELSEVITSILLA